MNNLSEKDELIKYLYKKRFFEYAEKYSNSSSNLSDEDLAAITEKINRLGKDERKELKKHLLAKFSSINDSHIFYLISKTKAKTKVQSADNETKEKIKNFYLNLNKISEIEIILKVVQYNPNLEIIFDFDSDSITHIEPTSDKNVKGRMDTELDKIFIGAKIDENDTNKLIGTVAHELCHLAMQMLFNNQAKPYEKNDNESVEKFKIINKKFLEQILQGIIIDEDGIIKSVYDNYKQDKWDAELIVRVPHILAHYEESGEQILNDNCQELFNYYNKEIIPKLNDFVDKSYLIRTKKHIEYINLKLNYLQRIEESNLRIENPIDLNEPLSSDKLPNIVLIKSSHNFNSCISVYQYLSENSITYAITDFGSFLKFKNDEILKSSDFNALIVDLEANSKIDFKNNFKSISNEKNLILIANEKIYETVKAEIENCFKNNKNKDILKLVTDKDYKYSDLTEPSQKQFIEMKVLFQDKELKLKQVLGIEKNSDISDELKDILDLDIFHKKIEIGCFDDDLVEELYVKRTLNHCIYLDKNIFEKSENSDLFVIQNDESLKIISNKYKLIKLNDLISHANENLIVNLSTNDKEKALNQFSEICQIEIYNDKNIHLIQNQSGKLKWVKSRGEVENLNEFLLKEFISGGIYRNC